MRSPLDDIQQSRQQLWLHPRRVARTLQHLLRAPRPQAVGDPVLHRRRQDELFLAGDYVRQRGAEVAPTGRGLGNSAAGAVVAARRGERLLGQLLIHAVVEDPPALVGSARDVFFYLFEAS